MATENTDDFECSASFTINFIAITTCTIAFEDPEDIIINIREQGTEFSFTKVFLYTIGPEPNADSENYGFDLDTSGVGLTLLSIEFVFTPTTPHIDPNVPEPKVGSVKVKGVFDTASAQTMQIQERVSIPLFVRMNTGTGN